MDNVRSAQIVSAPRRIAGRYRVEAELGRGGMGAVYRVFDEGTGRAVALKLLVRTDDRLLALFEREYGTLAMLDHARVIQVYDYGIAEGGLRYYTMELLGGSDIASLALPLPWAEVCSHLRDVCASLTLLHAQHLVHRDVNPRNIRLDESARAKLLDFGALSPFGVASEVVGTLVCMAPEAVRGRPLDARTNLFSVGAVMYWTLTGVLPFSIKSFSEAEAAWRVAPLPPSHHVPELPAALDELILSLLSIDPLGRPASAADVIDRLSAIADLDEEYTLLTSSNVSSGVLVGREPERAALEQHLASAMRGSGSVVVVKGVAGAGRSRLLHELCIHARLTGMRTLTVAGAECAREGALLQALVRGLVALAPDDARACLKTPRPALTALLQQLELAPELPRIVSSRDDPSGSALSLQESVADWLCEVSKRLPLVVVVDDAHLLAAGSAFVLTLLAQAASRHRLLLAVTRTTGRQAAPAVEQLSFLGASLALEPLSQASVEQLLSSAFGEVPNLTRLARRLTLAGRGNPGHMMRLLRRLVARQLVHYSGGVWTLPVELADDALAADEQDLSALLGGLPPLAHTLAQTFALRRGAMTDQMCLALSREAPRKVLEALSLLEDQQILLPSVDGYILEEAWRKALLLRFKADELAAAHLVLGRALWAQEPATFEAIEQESLGSLSVARLVHALSVGLHLLKGGELALSGTILRRTAIELTVRGAGLIDAAPVLEDAVDTYRRLGTKPHVFTTLLTALVLAGTYSNFRLCYRYGDETMELLTQLSGLKLARRLAPFLGGRIALFAGMLFAYAMLQLFPTRRATNNIPDLLLGLMGIGSAALGVYSLLQDRAAIERCAENLYMLRFFPRRHAVREIHEFQLSVIAWTRGDYVDSLHKVRAALAYVRSPAGASLRGNARIQLEVGILTMLGQLETLRTDAGARTTIAELERIDTLTSRQTRISTLLAHYGHRGERTPFLRGLQDLDRLAAETGAVWIYDVMLRKVWSSLALCEDVMALKSAVQQLDPLAHEAPSLVPLRDLLHACYLSERGMPGEALLRHGALFSAIDLENPSLPEVERLGYYARMLRKSGDPLRAKQICRAALRKLTPEQREFTILTFSAELELGLSMSLLGEHTEAAAQIDALLASQRHHDNPLLHGLVHGARAELAHATGDQPMVLEHLALMGDWLRKTEYPSLFAQYQRLAEKVHAPLPPEASQAAPSEAHEPDLLRGADADSAQLYQHILQLALAEANAHAGYLYLRQGLGLALAAASDAAPPPMAAQLDLFRRVAPRGELPFETELIADADNSGAVVPDSEATTTLSEQALLRVAGKPSAGRAVGFLLDGPTGDPRACLGALLLLEGEQPLHPLGRAFLAQMARGLSEL